MQSKPKNKAAFFAALSFIAMRRYLFHQSRKTSWGGSMDDQSPKINIKKSHGLRLVKGGRDDQLQNLEPPRVERKETKNKLVLQLRALADAIDDDVHKILNPRY